MIEVRYFKFCHNNLAAKTCVCGMSAIAQMDNIVNTHIKAGMIISLQIFHKTNPGRIEVCLPCLLFGFKLFLINARQISKLEYC